MPVSNSPKRISPRRGSRPIIRKAVLRERLFERLDRFQDGPATWVSGPAGSGKTTLVSSYLQDRRIPNLWYQVAEADKDPATFFYRLGSSFDKRGEGDLITRNRTSPQSVPYL